MQANFEDAEILELILLKLKIFVFGDEFSADEKVRCSFTTCPSGLSEEI